MPSDLLDRWNDFYVKVYLLKNGLYRHQFYFGTDLRFDKDLPCIEAAGIDAWCRNNEYKRIHLSW